MTNGITLQIWRSEILFAIIAFTSSCVEPILGYTLRLVRQDTPFGFNWYQLVWLYQPLYGYAITQQTHFNQEQFSQMKILIHKLNTDN